MVQLTKESQALTTFNKHKGRYKFFRMPFGVRMSQDIFQGKIDQTYENYRGASWIVDDIQVFGDDSTHDLHLRKVMQRARKAGIKYKFDKCIVMLKTCSFFGCRHHKPNRNLKTYLQCLI